MIPEKIYISKEHLTHLIEAYGIDTPDEDNKLIKYTRPTIKKFSDAQPEKDGWYLVSTAHPYIKHTYLWTCAYCNYSNDLSWYKDDYCFPDDKLYCDEFIHWAEIIYPTVNE